MIIDCHGHYTTAPAETEAWRKLQVQALGNPSQTPLKASLRISDDQIRAASDEVRQCSRFCAACGIGATKTSRGRAVRALASDVAVSEIRS